MREIVGEGVRLTPAEVMALSAQRARRERLLLANDALMARLREQESFNRMLGTLVVQRLEEIVVQANAPAPMQIGEPSKVQTPIKTRELALA